MASEYILQSDLIDIIFEKRNKIYGAYVIRKFDNNRLLKSLGITFFAAVLVCFVLYLQKKDSRLEIPDIDTVAVQIPQLPVEKSKLPDKHIKPPIQQLKASSQAWAKNIIITKEAIKSMLPHNLESLKIGSETFPGDISTPPLIATSGAGDFGDVVAKGLETLAVVVDAVSETAEIMPSFPGGMTALRKFLEQNLRNPQELEPGQTVSVKIKFVVGYNGFLKNFEIIEDGGQAFNNEVLRVLKKMPKWVAGKTKGEDISVFYNIPVKFQAVE